MITGLFVEQNYQPKKKHTEIIPSNFILNLLKSLIVYIFPFIIISKNMKCFILFDKYRKVGEKYVKNTKQTFLKRNITI